MGQVPKEALENRHFQNISNFLVFGTTVSKLVFALAVSVKKLMQLSSSSSSSSSNRLTVYDLGAFYVPSGVCKKREGETRF